MRISDWSSDVCSSDLSRIPRHRRRRVGIEPEDARRHLMTTRVAACPIDASAGDDRAVAAAIGWVLGGGPTSQSLQVPTGLGEPRDPGLDVGQPVCAPPPAVRDGGTPPVAHLVYLPALPTAAARRRGVAA